MTNSSRHNYCNYKKTSVAAATTIPFIIKFEIQIIPCFNNFFFCMIFNEAPLKQVPKTTTANITKWHY
jgi:hypothetical protein